MTKDEFIAKLEATGLWDVGVSVYRTNPLPLDRYSVFGSLSDATEYLSNPVCYPGQIIAVIADGSSDLYKVVADASGAYSLEEVSGVSSQDITLSAADIQTLLTTGTITITDTINDVDVINLILGTTDASYILPKIGGSSEMNVWGIFSSDESNIALITLTSRGLITYETFDQVEPNPENIPSTSTISDLKQARIGEDYFNIVDETARTNASTALSTANTASETATSASNTASSALTAANSASETASSALTTANSASETATSASSTAANALSTANTANETAASAKTAADSAASDASSALTTANTANTNASTALSTANAAQTAADSAATAASTAQSTAENAAQTASNAQSTADDAYTTALAKSVVSVSTSTVASGGNAKSITVNGTSYNIRSDLDDTSIIDVTITDEQYDSLIDGTSLTLSSLGISSTTSGIRISTETQGYVALLSVAYANDTSTAYRVFCCYGITPTHRGIIIWGTDFGGGGITLNVKDTAIISSVINSNDYATQMTVADSVVKFHSVSATVSSGTELSTITIDGTTYTVPSGGSGTTVTANPGSTTDTLTSIGIAGTNYVIEGGVSSQTIELTAEQWREISTASGGTLTITDTLNTDVDIIEISIPTSNMTFLLNKFFSNDTVSEWGLILGEDTILETFVLDSSTKELSLTFQNFITEDAISANPTDDATDTLSKLQVKDTVYSIPSGSTVDHDTVVSAINESASTITSATTFSGSVTLTEANLKTINGTSIIGSGDIEISAGTSQTVTLTADQYTELLTGTLAMTGTFSLDTDKLILDCTASSAGTLVLNKTGYTSTTSTYTMDRSMSLTNQEFITVGITSTALMATYTKLPKVVATGADGVLTGLQVDTDAYSVSSGGTKVVANDTSGTAGGDLLSIKIGESSYTIPSGGASYPELSIELTSEEINTLFNGASRETIEKTEEELPLDFNNDGYNVTISATIDGASLTFKGNVLKTINYDLSVEGATVNYNAFSGLLAEVNGYSYILTLMSITYEGETMANAIMTQPIGAEGSATIDHDTVISAINEATSTITSAMTFTGSVTLPSTANIKTINSTSLIGSGNIFIPVVSANPSSTTSTLTGLTIGSTNYAINDATARETATSASSAAQTAQTAAETAQTTAENAAQAASTAQSTAEGKSVVTPVVSSGTELSGLNIDGTEYTLPEGGGITTSTVSLTADEYTELTTNGLLNLSGTFDLTVDQLILEVTSTSGSNSSVILSKSMGVSSGNVNIYTLVNYIVGTTKTDIYYAEGSSTQLYLIYGHFNLVRPNRSIPSGTATTELENVQIGDDYYTIPTGTTVTATGDSSNVLQSLTVAGTTYSIPSGGGTSASSETLTLSASSWSNNTITVSSTIATADNILIISAAPSSLSAYGNAGVYASAQGAGTITFTCETTPTSDLSVNVVAL